MPRAGTSTTTRTPKSGQTTRRASTSRSRSKDALALLQEDHKRVQKLFRQFEKMDHQEDTEEMRALVDTACQELEMHAALEEEVFYPALREAIGEEHMELMEEAEIEHDTAKQLIASLRELQPGDPKYAATFTVLGEYVKHHVEEEESEMFKQAKKAKLDVQALGEELKNRRNSMMAGGDESEDENGPALGGKPMEMEDEGDMERASPRRRSR